MDLVRPALAALVAWLVADLVAGFVMVVWATSAQLDSGAGKVDWLVIPQTLVGLLAAMAAAYVHRRPDRDDRRRHALAVLGSVAVLAVVQALVNLMTSTVAWAVGGAFLAELFGGAVGWLLVSHVFRRGEQQEKASNRYF